RWFVVLVQDNNSKGAPLARHLRQFRSMLAVCRSGSTARATTLMPLSQSAIARAIRELEAALDMQIFERAARGMLPTAEGRLLAYRTQRAIEQLETAEREACSFVDADGPAPPVQRGRFAGTCSYRH